MGPRSKRAERCERCRLHVARCLCAEIPHLPLETRIVLVMHYREVPKTTATGPLALAALPNSELLVHGRVDHLLDLNRLHEEGRRVLLLFPSQGARPLDSALREEDARPVTLIVPDGNWRQATRAARRIPGLDRAERVFLPAGTPTEWGLRTEPKSGGLATFEAIARALGFLESTLVQQTLETLFRRMVKDTWAMRGLAPGDHPEARPPRVFAREEPVSDDQQAVEVVYRDEYMIAVNKPAGALVHRGWGRDARSMLQLVRDHVGQRVFPVHRLDRSTSGVLLFTFDPADVTRLQAQYNERSVRKTYLALCRGNSADLTAVDHPLAKDKESEKRPAVTHFRLLAAFGRYGLYEARPLTGRLHQIRRHLKHASHPLIGDVRYGKGDHNRLFRDKYGFHRLALHCSSLEFVHPCTGQNVAIDAPLTDDFRTLLETLQLSTAVPLRSPEDNCDGLPPRGRI